MNFTDFNQTDPCLYFHCPERSVSTAVYVILYIFAAAVVLLTVCGNMLVIISVCHFKQLHTPTNMLILSLAVSDLVIGLVVFPMTLISLIESCWIFNRVFCICFLLTAYMVTGTSIFDIALIAIDRYVALSNPFLYTRAVTVSIMCFVVLCNWCLSFSYSLAVHYFNRNFDRVVMCPGRCFIVVDEVWSLVDLLFIFVSPLSIIIILYIQVFVIAKKHATAIRDLNIQTGTSKNEISMKSERKAAKVLGIVVSVYLVCLLPYFIHSLLGRVIEVGVGLFQIILVLVHLNSTVNPIIYALFYPWFRRCVKLILTLQILKTHSSLIKVIY
ncbi:trace amine-associated receptor 13c-like [Hoplias malabaricus]|uniref:trace amine-associated receptor 13c-like n=1 Tax=Hoplias malabaricus TaxID=27720 RepID=UPI0034618713